MEQKQEELFSEEDIIFAYTSENATEDGFLVATANLNPKWEGTIISHITVGLLEHYTIAGGYNLLNVSELLTQCAYIIKKDHNKTKKPDTFYSGKIELPSGEQQDIYIAQNETGAYTIMLPDDY